jgi:hypothetical protein
MDALSRIIKAQRDAAFDGLAQAHLHIEMLTAKIVELTEQLEAVKKVENDA